MVVTLTGLNVIRIKIVNAIVFFLNYLYNFVYNDKYVIAKELLNKTWLDIFICHQLSGNY